MEAIAPITPQTIIARKTATIMGLDGSQNGEHLKDGQILQEELLWCALSVDAKDMSEVVKTCSSTIKERTSCAIIRAMLFQLL